MNNIEKIEADIYSLTNNNKELMTKVKNYLNVLHNKKPTEEEFTRYRIVKDKIANLTLLRDILKDEPIAKQYTY